MKPIYNKALQGGRASEPKLMELAWSTVGFEELVKKVELKDVGLNWFELKSSLLKYLKDLFSKKCIAATHLLVFMIADERPYKSLTDAKLRELEVQLEDAMRRNGMTVVMCQC